MSGSKVQRPIHFSSGPTTHLLCADAVLGPVALTQVCLTLPVGPFKRPETKVSELRLLQRRIGYSRSRCRVTHARGLQDSLSATIIEHHPLRLLYRKPSSICASCTRVCWVRYWGLTRVKQVPTCVIDGRANIELSMFSFSGYTAVSAPVCAKHPQCILGVAGWTRALIPVAHHPAQSAGTAMLFHSTPDSPDVCCRHAKPFPSVNVCSATNGRAFAHILDAIRLSLMYSCCLLQ